MYVSTCANLATPKQGSLTPKIAGHHCNGHIYATLIYCISNTRQKQL